MPVKKTRSRRAQKAESPPPSSSDEQLPENDDEQPEQSGNASKRKNKTYVRRSPESVDVSPTVSKKRSSPRLKRLREMNENENENASDADENDGDEDEDSVVGRRRGRAIKPPPAKKRRTVPLYRKQCTPSFVDDDELLLELGVAYISKKTKGTRATRKKRISYHESVEVDGHVYEYHKNGKYELVRVQAHKIEFEEADSEWYRNVQFKKLRKFMGRRHDESGDDEHKHGADMDENENGSDGDGGDDDALTFGELVFECEWKGWGDTTWESWDTLKDNVVFEEYCAAQHWDMAKPMQCRLDAHSPEDVKRVLLNMAIFGDHHTRKAMKILLCENMNMW